MYPCTLCIHITPSQIASRSINTKKQQIDLLHYFLHMILQMSFQPLYLFKILIVIVLISIGILGRSLVNT